jgi:two-component system cell cycle sensor histidine kinase/response regulator CckA
MKVTKTAAGRDAVPRRPYILISICTVTALAVVAALAPARMLMFGWVALGPALAASTANPAAVLGVGGYALALAFVISTWQGLLGTTDQLLRLLVLVCVTAIGWALARHQQRLERAAARAAEEREMLAALTEQSADAIICSTLDGKITTWNSGAERMYGYRADEVVGRQFESLLPPRNAAHVSTSLELLAAGDQLRIPEAQRRRSDGTSVTVSVIVSPIRDRHGRVVAAAATERDLTEVKRREAEERAAKERLERATRLESLGQLAGGVAHDFNNLLAIILNYTEFLAEQVTGEGAGDLARIRDAAERGRTLTGELLLFAKREPTQTKIVDLNVVVTDAGDLLSRTIGAGVRLECRTGPDRIPVRANRGRLDQILLNLVVNARDAMADGGVVTVGTEVAEVTADAAEPLPPGRYALLTVRDTGTGMTAEVKNRLFEPFFTTKSADRGTGLGLATVYGIVGDAGGHIGVESELGVGTTFRIMLPLAEEPGEPSAEPADTPPARGHGERVAVLDDDESVRDLVVRILRDNGYQTVELSEDALAAADLNGVALLVTEVLRPGVAGQLRSRCPRLPVLYLSGQSEAEVGERIDLDDAARLLRKPFTAVELLAAVGEALPVLSPTPSGPAETGAPR